jgi:hypothetical protein
LSCDSLASAVYTQRNIKSITVVVVRTCFIPVSW